MTITNKVHVRVRVRVHSRQPRLAHLDVALFHLQSCSNILLTRTSLHISLKAMRGRRVALLLTGLWPLLAKDDVPAAETNVTIDADDYDFHNDALQQLPRLPLEVLASASNPTNIVMVDPVFDTKDALEDLVDIDENDAKPDHHVETNEQDRIRDSQDGTSEEEQLPLLDSEEADEKEEVSETSSQEGSEADAPENSDAEVDCTAEDTSESPLLDEVDAAAEADPSTETTKEDEAESIDAQPDGETEATEVPTDEDEDVATDRVLVDYASKSAGALILEKSPAMKGTSNLLNADNDKYAIAPCSEKKFVVIGLSEDILVKQVKLANYERYSSHVKDFQIMGSQTMGDWVDLGSYTAEPGNGEQAFDLKEPAWARYLKFRFLSHHGSEHYCTYTQIKVHGSTMLQGFHEQWDSQEDLEEENNGSEKIAVEADSAGRVETRVEASNEDGDSVEKEEDEASPEAERNVPDKHGAGGEVIDGSYENPSENASEGESVKRTDAVNEDNSGDASSHESADDPKGTDKARSNSASKETEGTTSTDGRLPSNTDSDDETFTESDFDMDRSSTYNPGSPSALSCASIGVSSQRAVNADCTGSTEQLDTSAIKLSDKDLRTVVTSVVKKLVAAEAIMTVMDAESVVDEVKEIQEKLRRTGTGKPRIGGGTEKSRENHSDVETAETLPDDQHDSATILTERSVQEEGTVGIESSNVIESEGSPVENNTEDIADVDEPEESVQRDPKQGDEDQAKKRSMEETAETSEKSDQVDSDPALADIIARFPSAACMDGLDYQNFKAKIVAARKDRASAQGGSPSGNTGKMEPIFKTLTDEIKGLQISQSVQDQYIKAVISCYQKVMLEMAETLRDVEARQEKRLLYLEEAMDAMRSSSFKRVLAAVVTVVSTCLLGARLLYTAMVASRETFFASGLIDTTALQLILGVCSLGFLAMFYYFYAVRYKELQQGRSKEVTEKRTETKIESTEVLNQTAVLNMAPTATVKSLASSNEEQSDNGSDASDPAVIPVISFLPRDKRPAVRNEPALVPME